jgi:hypothetical protein
MTSSGTPQFATGTPQVATGTPIVTEEDKNKQNLNDGGAELKRLADEKKLAKKTGKEPWED